LGFFRKFGPIKLDKNPPADTIGEIFKPNKQGITLIFTDLPGGKERE